MNITARYIKEPQQKYRLEMVSHSLLSGLYLVLLDPNLALCFYSGSKCLVCMIVSYPINEST